MRMREITGIRSRVERELRVDLGGQLRRQLFHKPCVRALLKTHFLSISQVWNLRQEIHMQFVMRDSWTVPRGRYETR
jgi:hypothetical protein